MDTATLEVKHGQRVGTRYPIDGRTVVGRDVDCDVQLFDEGLSRRHFAIEADDGTYAIEDLGSSNGTYVNGTRIEAAVDLKTGDLISAGTTQLQFWIAGPKPASVSLDPGVREQADLELVDDAPEDRETQIKKRVEVGSLRWMTSPAAPQVAHEQVQSNRALSVLYKVGNLCNAEVNLGRLYESICDAILEVVNGDRVFLILWDGSSDVMEQVVTRSARPSFSGRQKVSRTVVEECIRRGISILSADAMADQRFKAGQSVMLQHIRSVMCVPVESNRQVLGAIYVDNLAASGMFVEFDLELVSAIGQQAGVAIERARLSQNLQHLFYGTIRTLVATLEAKDPYTAGHSERVTSYSVQIAQEMGLPQENVDLIHLAGLLHDIGKVGISEKILHKPERLTDEEFEIIKTHPVIGADIVRNIQGTDEVVDIVRHHHERMDGRGYPDGLTGDQISQPTRILTVADSYDAMCSKRAYRKDLSKEEIIAEIERCSGTQFDPTIAKVFIGILQDDRLSNIREVYERGLDIHFGHYFKSFRKARTASSGMHRSLSESDLDERRKTTGKIKGRKDVSKLPTGEVPVDPDELIG